jgi:thiazole synthase
MPWRQAERIVTVALRRADLRRKHDPFANILDFIDPGKYLLLPNTSGAWTLEAVRLARLAAAAGLPRWVAGNIPTHYLLLIRSTLKRGNLVQEGFTVPQ